MQAPNVLTLARSQPSWMGVAVGGGIVPPGVWVGSGVAGGVCKGVCVGSGNGVWVASGVGVWVGCTGVDVAGSGTGVRLAGSACTVADAQPSQALRVMSAKKTTASSDLL